MKGDKRIFIPKKQVCPILNSAWNSDWSVSFFAWLFYPQQLISCNDKAGSETCGVEEQHCHPMTDSNSQQWGDSRTICPLTPIMSKFII
jgi:hypothetical protein